MSKFVKGQSGNPNGRPVGIKDKRLIFRELVEPYKADLAKKAVDLALSGNEQMLRLLLDRLLPAKPRDNTLPEIEGLEGNIAEQCNKIISLIANGSITPIEANTLLHTLKFKTDLVDINEIREELNKIKHEMKDARVFH